MGYCFLILTDFRRIVGFGCNYSLIRIFCEHGYELSTYRPSFFLEDKS
jgi:hypothetical protein